MGRGPARQRFVFNCTGPADWARDTQTEPWRDRSQLADRIRENWLGPSWQPSQLHDDYREPNGVRCIGTVRGRSRRWTCDSATPNRAHVQRYPQTRSQECLAAEQDGLFQEWVRLNRTLFLSRHANQNLHNSSTNSNDRLCRCEGSAQPLWPVFDGRMSDYRDAPLLRHR